MSCEDSCVTSDNSFYVENSTGRVIKSHLHFGQFFLTTLEMGFNTSTTSPLDFAKFFFNQKARLSLEKILWHQGLGRSSLESSLASRSQGEGSRNLKLSSSSPSCYWNFEREGKPKGLREWNRGKKLGRERDGSKRWSESPLSPI